MLLAGRAPRRHGLTGSKKNSSASHVHSLFATFSCNKQLHVTAGQIHAQFGCECVEPFYVKSSRRNHVHRLWSDCCKYCWKHAWSTIRLIMIVGSGCCVSTLNDATCHHAHRQALHVNIKLRYSCCITISNSISECCTDLPVKSTATARVAPPWHNIFTWASLLLGVHIVTVPTSQPTVAHYHNHWLKLINCASKYPNPSHCLPAHPRLYLQSGRDERHQSPGSDTWRQVDQELSWNQTLVYHRTRQSTTDNCLHSAQTPTGRVNPRQITVCIPHRHPQDASIHDR